jgi:hypothetical protein
MRKRWAWVLGLLAATAAAAAPAAKKAIEARFYYDLGPESIDVSSYPQKQKENYDVFAKTCSQCHTLARPINAPYVSRTDWKRYISRMRRKAANSGSAVVTTEQAKTALEFLVYDSDVRKVKDREAFQARTDALKKKFEKLQAAKPDVQNRDNRATIKNPAPYTGTKP